MNADAALPGSVSVTHSPAWTSVTSPFWRPDGGALAYGSHEIPVDGGSWVRPEVHLVNADGSGQRLLGLGTPWARSPDGGRIVLARRPSQSGPEEVWVARTDGSGEIRLPVALWSRVRGAWSPDGSRIAVAGGDQDGVYHTYLMRPDGSGLESIPSNDFFGGWSPDGREVLLLRESPDGSRQVLSRLRLADGQVQLIGEITALPVPGFAWQPIVVYPGR